MRILAVCSLFFLLIMQACSYASLTLTAKKNEFPISFSEGIFGYNNELIFREGYEVVHHFKMEKSVFTWNAWNIGKAWGPQLQGQDNPKRVDLSNEFDALLQSHNGEAIVNLKVKAEQNVGISLISLITGTITLGLLAPHRVTATIEGDVIRLTTPTTASRNNSIGNRKFKRPF